MVPFNSPNDKLSNDTPHDYGTLKYKSAVLRGFKGVVKGFYGTKRAQMTKIWFYLETQNRIYSIYIFGF